MQVFHSPGNVLRFQITKRFICAKFQRNLTTRGTAIDPSNTGHEDDPDKAYIVSWRLCHEFLKRKITNMQPMTFFCHAHLLCKKPQILMAIQKVLVNFVYKFLCVRVRLKTLCEEGNTNTMQTRCSITTCYYCTRLV